MKVKIIENSLLAKIAAFHFKGRPTAITLGRSIHLHHISKTSFLKDKRWLRHELEHVRQFQKHGFLSFIFLYLLETLRKGYRSNKWEVAARACENDLKVLDDFEC